VSATGTNTGDQTSIVGITGTKAEFDAAVTDGNILYVGDVTQYTDEAAQDAVGAMVDSSLTYVDGTPLLQRAALTGAITASAGSNATALGSFTTAQLNAALSDNDVATGGGTATGTNTGDQTSIVGITGTLAEFNAALTGADFATGGGTATGTNTGDQTSIVGITGTVAEFNAALTGADFATGGGTATGTNTGDQTITLTGAVTGSGTGSFAVAIASNAVTNTNLADMATATFKGRATAGTGDPEDLTGTQATALLDVATGSLKGLLSASDKSKLDGIAAGAQVSTIGVTTANGVSGSSSGGTTPSLTITLGAITPSSVACTGLITTSSASAGFGYATGAGGTVTQATNKSTGVTLNRPTGEITMNGAALAAATIVTFVLTNSVVAAADQVVCTHHATGTFGGYTINARVTGAGSVSIAVRNNTAGSLSEAIVIKFSVIKAATS
jgi:hypothetical protein